MTLIDDNDNDPELKENLARMELYEDAPIGTQLVRFPATDADQVNFILILETNRQY